jgi:protein TonB
LASAAPLRPLSSPAPSFPRDAINDSRREVLISARLSIAANGDVTRVEFTGTTPRDRAFERNARSALQSWRFPEGAADRSYSTTLVFKVE